MLNLDIHGTAMQLTEKNKTKEKGKGKTQRLQLNRHTRGVWVQHMLAARPLSDIFLASVRVLACIGHSGWSRFSSMGPGVGCPMPNVHASTLSWDSSRYQVLVTLSFFFCPGVRCKEGEHPPKGVARVSILLCTAKHERRKDMP